MRVITRQRFNQNANSPREKDRPKKGLSSRKVNDYLRFSGFLVLIGVAYIWNSYEAERKVKMMEAHHQEVKKLKAEYLLRRSTLSAGTRFSEIKDQLDTLGLRPLREPAFKLVQGLDVPLDRLKKLDREDLELKYGGDSVNTELAIQLNREKAEKDP
ncbi:MAG: FtsL-like putative cell division protein [Bacteroidota bacterium]